MCEAESEPTEYMIHRILPVMDLPEPIRLGPVIFCSTRHFQSFDLSSDEQYRGVLALADRFRSIQGRKIGHVGVMLIPRAEAESLIRADIPRLARDALSLCHITKGTVLHSNNTSWPCVVYSDYFDILPVFIRGLKFRVLSPGVWSLNNDVGRFEPIYPAHLPSFDRGGFKCDDALLGGFNASIKMLLKGREVRPLRQLFRSLSMANQACRIMQEPDADVYDLGTRIILWVSAFETLVHPGGKDRVGLSDVLSLIEDSDWRPVSLRNKLGRKTGRALNVGHRRFAYKTNKKTKRENAACHFYRQLYGLRNSIAHGNRITRSAFHTRNAHRWWRRDLVVPLLYRACIRERMMTIGCLPRPLSGKLSVDELREGIREGVIQADFDESIARMLLMPRPRS